MSENEANELLWLKPTIRVLRQWHQTHTPMDEGIPHEDAGVLLRYIDLLHLRVEELKRAK